MSDIEYQLEQAAEQARNEVSQLIERGDYYKEQGENAQALKNYVSALKAYSNYATRKSQVIKVIVAISGSAADPTGAGIIYSQALFDLYSLLKRISDFYPYSSTVRLYLEFRLIQIGKKINEYEEFLNVDRLEKSKNIINYVKTLESTVNENKEKLSTIKPLKEETDQDFKTIRKALADISSEKICPLTLEESGGCFIATVVYADYFHADLKTFREFRDDVLMSNFMGRLLVRIYYNFGPDVARYVSKKMYFKKILRLLLEYLASAIRSRRNLGD